MLIKKQEPDIITVPNAKEGIWEAKYEGDKFRIHHAQKVSPMLKKAQFLRENSDGFTEDREMRLIGVIPMLEFVKHPEWATDQNAIKKWLKTPAGEPYRTVKKGI